MQRVWFMAARKPKWLRRASCNRITLANDEFLPWHGATVWWDVITKLACRSAILLEWHTEVCVMDVTCSPSIPTFLHPVCSHRRTSYPLLGRHCLYASVRKHLTPQIIRNMLFLNFDSKFLFHEASVTTTFHEADLLKISFQTLLKFY